MQIKNVHNKDTDSEKLNHLHVTKEKSVNTGIQY